MIPLLAPPKISSDRDWKIHDLIDQTVPILMSKNGFDVDCRTLMKGDVWDRLRKTIFRSANHRCSLCGRNGHNDLNFFLYCAERWIFTETSQILTGFQAVCHQCYDFVLLLNDKKHLFPDDPKNDIAHFFHNKKMTKYFVEHLGFNAMDIQTILARIGTYKKTIDALEDFDLDLSLIAKIRIDPAVAIVRKPAKKHYVVGTFL